MPFRWGIFTSRTTTSNGSLLDERDGVVSRRRPLCIDSPEREPFGKGRDQFFFVIDEEDFHRATPPVAGPATGRVIMNVVPLPISLSTDTDPPVR